MKSPPLLFPTIWPPILEFSNRGNFGFIVMDLIEKSDRQSVGIITIIITRPKPAYGRQGLAGSWGQDTDEVNTFLVFLTSHFAPAALSSDLTNLGPLTMESDQKP